MFAGYPFACRKCHQIKQKIQKKTLKRYIYQKAMMQKALVLVLTQDNSASKQSATPAAATNGGKMDEVVDILICRIMVNMLFLIETSSRSQCL